MEKWADVFLDEYKFSIVSASFERKGIPDEGEATIQINDSLSVNPSSDKTMVTFSRHVYYEPEALFSVTIVLEAELFYAEEKNHNAMISNGDEMLKFVIAQGQPVLLNLSSRAAMLISQLTSGAGQTPIITPSIDGSQFNIEK